MHKLYSLILLLLVFNTSLAQDLEQLKNLKAKDAIKGKGILINGGFTANSRYYVPFQSDNRIPTFQYTLLGRLQMDILGLIKMPVSFSYTNRNSSIVTSLGKALPSVPISQPFNRLTLKPTYKGHTLHLGTTSLNFSPMTLASYRVQGVGYEYKSNKFPIYGGITTGTFRQAIPINLNIPSAINRPSYKRTGWAAKVGYKKNDDYIEITALNASDRKNSLVSNLDTLNVFAKANFASSVKFQKVFFKKLLLSSEYARSTVAAIGDGIELNLLKNTLSPNENSKNALKANLDYKLNKGTVGLEYKSIDPNYESFGVYFFNEDLETYSAKSSHQLLDGKLTLNDAFGYQKNHSKSKKPQAMNRWVGSLDVAYLPSEKINLTANYSNFIDYTNLRNSFQYLTGIDPFLQLDTLNYRQINQNIGFSSSFQLPKSGELSKSILATANFQGGNSEQGSLVSQTKIINMNINGVLANEADFLNCSVGMNVLKSTIPQSSDFMYGPILNISKGYFENKFKITANVNYNNAITSSMLIDNKVKKTIILGNIGAQATIKKSHSLALNCLFLNNKNRTNPADKNDNLKELTINLTYNYNFKDLGFKF